MKHKLTLIASRNSPIEIEAILASATLQPRECTACNHETTVISGTDSHCGHCGNPDFNDIQTASVLTFDTEQEGLASVACVNEDCNSLNIVIESELQTIADTQDDTGSVNICCAACGEGISVTLSESDEKDDKEDKGDDKKEEEKKDDKPSFEKKDDSETAMDHSDEDEKEADDMGFGEEEEATYEDPMFDELSNDDEHMYDELSGEDGPVVINPSPEDEPEPEPGAEEEAGGGAECAGCGKADCDCEDKDKYAEQSTMEVPMYDIIAGAEEDGKESEVAFHYIGDTKVMCTINDATIAVLTKHDELAGVESFGTSAFMKGLHTAFAACDGDIQKVLADYKFESVNIEITASALNSYGERKALAEIENEIQVASLASSEGYRQSAQLAAAGINRGMFVGRSNPIAASLTTQFEAVGVANAGAMVAKAFAEHSDAQLSQVFEVANEVASRSDESRNDLAQTVASLAVIAPQVSASDTSVIAELATPFEDDLAVAKTQVVASAASETTGLSPIQLLANALKRR